MYSPPKLFKVVCLYLLLLLFIQFKGLNLKIFLVFDFVSHEDVRSLRFCLYIGIEYLLCPDDYLSHG